QGRKSRRRGRRIRRGGAPLRHQQQTVTQPRRDRAGLRPQQGRDLRPLQPRASRRPHARRQTRTAPYHRTFRRSHLLRGCLERARQRRHGTQTYSTGEAVPLRSPRRRSRHHHEANRLLPGLTRATSRTDPITNAGAALGDISLPLRSLRKGPLAWSSHSPACLRGYCRGGEAVADLVEFGALAGGGAAEAVAVPRACGTAGADDAGVLCSAVRDPADIEDLADAFELAARIGRYGAGAATAVAALFDAGDDFVGIKALR